jgi:hypothetical protein
MCLPPLLLLHYTICQKENFDRIVGVGKCGFYKRACFRIRRIRKQGKWKRIKKDEENQKKESSLLLKKKAI